MARRIEEMGGEIRKNCRVVSLQSDGPAIRSVTYEQNGETAVLQGDIVISSMPVRDLVAGLGDSVPEWCAAIAVDALPRFCDRSVCS